jgi:hypothetical protein
MKKRRKREGKTRGTIEESGAAFYTNFPPKRRFNHSPYIVLVFLLSFASLFVLDSIRLLRHSLAKNTKKKKKKKKVKQQERQS